MTPFSAGQIENGAVRADGGTSEVWIGRIAIPSGAASVYFKMQSARQFWIESVCARLAEAAGLPTGKLYWGRIERSDLPDSKQWNNGESWRVVLAVQANRGATLERMGESIVPEALQGTSSYPLMCAFDELIANGDRHNGNLLVDGRGQYWLIDHGHAFGGPDHDLANPYPIFENQLLAMAILNKRLRARQTLAVELATAIAMLGEAMKHVGEVLTLAPEAKVMQNFLQARYDSLRDLLAARFEIDGQGSLRLPTPRPIER